MASGKPRLLHFMARFMGDDGWKNRELRVGRNPGRLKNVNEDNLIQGTRRRAHLISAEPAAVYARVAIVLDDNEPVKSAWEEKVDFLWRCDARSS